MSIHVLAVGFVTKTGTDTGKDGKEETISCMYTHPVNDPGEFKRRTKRCKAFPTGVIELIPLL